MKIKEKESDENVFQIKVVGGVIQSKENNKINNENEIRMRQEVLLAPASNVDWQ